MLHKVVSNVAGNFFHTASLFQHKCKSLCSHLDVNNVFFNKFKATNNGCYTIYILSFTNILKYYGFIRNVYISLYYL
jgi:hypothetical protein